MTVAREVCGWFRLSLLKKTKRFAKESVSDFKPCLYPPDYKKCFEKGAFNQLEDFWISASDLGRDGDFYWDSTREFFSIYDDWMEGEPVLGIESHHCAHVAIDSNDTYRWWNGDCWARKRFVCESVPTAESMHSKSAAAVKNSTTSNRFQSKTSVYEISTDKVTSSFFSYRWYKFHFSYFKCLIC
jgi:Lectin C-type domain